MIQTIKEIYGYVCDISRFAWYLFIMWFIAHVIYDVFLKKRKDENTY